MAANQKSVQQVLEGIPSRYRGPGGAVAVLKDGELVGQRVWGYADLDQRIPLTPKTQMPVCSITKQFVCALLIDLQRNPTPAMVAKGGDIAKQFSEMLREFLQPEIVDGGLTINHLCDMQSGLRDYWAMTTLWGAKPDGEFLLARDCSPALERTKSFHFKPGAEFSYCNVNFHVLARVIERVSGESLGKLLDERILGPAGMRTALLCPNTGQHPPPCVGYEGDEQHGFLPAVNRMEWSGDAGLVASLTDMIAYEKYLHRSISDPQTWYHAVAKPQTFSDSASAPYHYGLSHVNIDGVTTYGHGGALRGYRLERRHVPQQRLSVVVMFNHEADPSAAAEDVLRGILNLPRSQPAAILPSADWFGTFLDQDTQLALTVSRATREGEVKINYAGHPESVNLTDGNQAQSREMVAAIDGDSLRVHRVGDNRKINARRITPRESSFKDTSLPGDYRCNEIDSTFHCSGEEGMLYGGFDGYLGQGIASLMRYLGDDVWAFTCPRGLDAPAPGDWTMVFRRDEHGAVVGFRVGCWLARGVEYVKTC